MLHAVDDGCAFERPVMESVAAEVEVLRGGGKRVAHPRETTVNPRRERAAREPTFAGGASVEHRKGRGFTITRHVPFIFRVESRMVL